MWDSVAAVPPSMQKFTEEDFPLPLYVAADTASIKKDLSPEVAGLL